MRVCYSCSPYRLARGCFTTFDWLLDGRTYDKLDVTSGKLDALGDLHSTLREVLEQVRILLKSAGVWLDCRKQACSVTFVYDSPIWLQCISRSRPVTTGPPATPVRTMSPPACLDCRRMLSLRLRGAAELKFLPTKCRPPPIVPRLKKISCQSRFQDPLMCTCRILIVECRSIVKKGSVCRQGASLQSLRS